MMNEDLNKMMSDIAKSIGTAQTSACTGPSGTFSMDSLRAAVAAVNQVEDEHARRFNERFVKPNGFDLELGDMMFVGRLFDVRLIPSQWQTQVLRSQFMEPFDLVFAAGSPALRRAAETASCFGYGIPRP